MTAIVDVVLPFFAMIATGWLALHFRWIDRAAVAGLNAFVFYVALPSLLTVTLAKAPIERLLEWRFYLVFYGASAIVYLIVLGISRARGAGLGEAAIRALGGAWGNWGYMGIPLLLATFGPEGAAVAVLAMLGDLLLTSPVTIALIETSRSGRGGLAGAGSALRNLVRNPLVLATFVGFGLAATGTGVPYPVQRFLELAGAAASPCALFALGASLVGAPIGHGRGEIASLTLVRLVLHPGLVWLGATQVIPLPPVMAQAAVLTAALPTAASVFVLAQRYDLWAVRASTLVLSTHALSLLTLGILLALLLG